MSRSGANRYASDAALLRDYSEAVAKRQRHAFVDPRHVVCALRWLQPSEFDNGLGDAWASDTRILDFGRHVGQPGTTPEAESLFALAESKGLKSVVAAISDLIQSAPDRGAGVSADFNHQLQALRDTYDNPRPFKAVTDAFKRLANSAAVGRLYSPRITELVTSWWFVALTVAIATLISAISPPAWAPDNSRAAAVTERLLSLPLLALMNVIIMALAVFVAALLTDLIVLGDKHPDERTLIRYGCATRIVELVIGLCVVALAELTFPSATWMIEAGFGILVIALALRTIKTSLGLADRHGPLTILFFAFVGILLDAAAQPADASALSGGAIAIVAVTVGLSFVQAVAEARRTSWRSTV